MSRPLQLKLIVIWNLSNHYVKKILSLGYHQLMAESIFSLGLLSALSQTVSPLSPPSHIIQELSRVLIIIFLHYHFFYLHPLTPLSVKLAIVCIENNVILSLNIMR